MTFCQKTQNRPDSCAIFWNINILKLVKTFKVHFQRNRNVNSVFTRPQVGLIVALKHNLKPDQMILVGTSHLNFDNYRGDIKAAQVHTLMEALSQVRTKYEKKGKIARIIVAVDFNSGPSSQIYKFMREGQMSAVT